MFWHWSKESAARLGAKVIAVVFSTSPAELLAERHGVRAGIDRDDRRSGGQARSRCGHAGPDSGHGAGADSELAPAAACALVESVTPVPGSDFRTASTAVSKASKGGGVPSAGI